MAKQAAGDVHQNGDPSTIRRYVASWKQARNSAGKEVFAPLEFRPGEEAQVDWGEAWIIHNGTTASIAVAGPSVYRLHGAS